MPWNEQELRQLEDFVRDGLPAARIAQLMERSTVAIRAKAASKGLRLRGRMARRQHGLGSEA
ncbi:MAG TPA: hypothetical protein VFE52_10090 [Devosia sp.]|nr:hypothetical protein [Devosia sp.]